MESDPNDPARQAFGYEPMPPAAAEPAPAVVQTQALADWWPRAAALVLDWLASFAIGLAVGLPIGFMLGETSDTQITILTYAIGIPIGLLYAPLLMIRGGKRNGQTLGKQAMGLRVVRENGQPVTLGNALLREVIGRQLLIVITLYVYAPIDYLWPLWDKKNQCLHDKVADTLVVRAGAPAAATWAPPAAPAAPSSPPPSSAAGEQPVAGWLPPQSGV